VFKALINIDRENTLPRLVLRNVVRKYAMTELESKYESKLYRLVSD